MLYRQGGKARRHFVPAGVRLERFFLVSPNGDDCSLHLYRIGRCEIDRVREFC
jgi:hypothetical protein